MGPEPAVTLEEAKAQVRIDHDDEDDLLERLIAAATAKVERDCDRAFGEQTWEVILDAFPDDEVEIPWGPLVSVTSLTYLDGDEVETVMDAADYLIEEGHLHGLIFPLSSWPTTYEHRNAVVIRYVAGDGWPEDVRHAVLLLVGHWFNAREAVGRAADNATVPLAYEALIASHRRMFA